MVAMLRSDADEVFEQANTQFYSVARLKQLLPLYTVLGYSRPPRDDETRVKVSRVIGEAPWSKASAHAADLERAIRWLNERDWRAAFVIRAVLIVGMTERDARSYLSRVHEVDVHHSTVHQWKKDGLELMSAYLCGKVL